MRSALDDFIEESKKETLIKSIRNLMKNLNLTLEQAMNALDIPSDQQAELKPLV